LPATARAGQKATREMQHFFRKAWLPSKAELKRENTEGGTRRLERTAKPWGENR